MQFNTLFSSLTLLLSAAAFLPAVAASTNGTSLETRTFGNVQWTQEKCTTISGNWWGYRYNFGCLCEDDIPTFCSNNGISSAWKSVLTSYVQQHGIVKWYPANAQPTCDGNGGYDCGSLQRKSDGTCGQTTCDPKKCSTNGGCCPRGQTYQNGQCCGKVGCGRSGSTCKPVLQCQTYENNGVCCPANTQGWKGYDTICCPSGQSEKNGQCVCPDGTTKNGDTCKSNCVTGHKWCSTRCCPTGSSEKNGQCVCDSPQQQLQGSGDSAKCVDKCPTGHSFCSTQCCPNGSSEKWGKCVCDSPQQQLQGTGSAAKCVDKCPTGHTYCSTQCCPNGSSEKNGKCVCDSPSQQLQGSGSSAKCVDKCPTGHSWCSTQCCPTGSSEKWGKCVCDSPSQVLSGSGTSAKCIPKCVGDEQYNPSTGNCDKICDASAGYFYQKSWKGKGMCCKKGLTACNNVCCPAGKEEIGETGVCCKKGSKVEGGRCIEPTGGNSNARRALSGRVPSDQINLTPAAIASFGLPANKDGKLCPAGMAACPIPGRATDYECLDSFADLQSCGGCASLGQGVDCTAIEGARWMGCNVGKCEVYSCRKGYRKSESGDSCIKI